MTQLILNILYYAFVVAGWFLLSGWAIAVVMLVLLPKRQTPDAARTWLLLVFFLPWLGLIFYLLIGENRLPHEFKTRHKRITERLQTRVQALKRNTLTVLKPALPANLMPAATLAENLGYLPVAGGNTAQLLSGYDEIIEQIVEDIDTAEQYVHLLFYIIADDATGRHVFQALKRAVERGVTCRVLVDSFGALPFIKKLGAEMTAAGIELHYILPIGLFRRHLTRIDLRNHRKIVIVDGRLAYTGSQNIVDATYGYNIEGLIYEELMVRLTGPIVLALQVVFISDWYLVTNELLDQPEFFPAPTVTGPVTAQAVPSGPTYVTENFQRLVVTLLHNAKKRVVITTPYFIPDLAMLQAMQTAVLRGVEVVLIVSSKVDQAIVGLAQSAYYEELLAAGVEINVYERALLHAKHMSIDDDIALIGSGNMDKRSFDLNFEISMLFYDAGVTTALRAEEAKYMGQAQRLTTEKWSQRPSRQQFLENLAKLVSPLL